MILLFLVMIMAKDFSRVASVRYNRSKFDLSHGVKTTMSVGKLYPLKLLEVLPGDSFKSVMTAVCRCTSSFLKPIIDNLFMEVHHFFVPFRLLYDDSERVFGNPKPSAYSDNELAEYPSYSGPISVTPGTVADYLGLPVKVNSSNMQFISAGCSVLPFRAFARVYNDWFRNENTVDEMLIQTGEVAYPDEVVDDFDWSPGHYTGQLPFVGKKKDYFTAGLPNTQKGMPSLVPLAIANLPVVTGPVHSTVNVSDSGAPFYNTELFWGPSGDTSPDLNYNSNFKPLFSRAGNGMNTNQGTVIGPDSTVVDDNNTVSVVPVNLWANGSGASSTVNVSDLRTAFQLQKMLEKDARYGSRYNEFLLGHFGVTSPDARLQFTEYLGGGRIPISVQQVSQTSSPTEDSPLGAFGANSQSVGRTRYSKGFTEHGYVVTVGCIRQIHTYQQGIPRMFFRHKREDFYDPLLANISEQPVWRKQIFGYVSNGSDTSPLTDNVFNYNEAWADYRYEPSIVTGQLRSGISNSLDIWHLADYYSESPVFGQQFTNENADNVNRVLSVPSSSQDNFLVDLWFNVSAIRVMPVYSTPGLVDHH